MILISEKEYMKQFENDIQPTHKLKSFLKSKQNLNEELNKKLNIAENEFQILNIKNKIKRNNKEIQKISETLQKITKKDITNLLAEFSVGNDEIPNPLHKPLYEYHPFFTETRLEIYLKKNIYLTESVFSEEQTKARLKKEKDQLQKQIKESGSDYNIDSNIAEIEQKVKKIIPKFAKMNLENSSKTFQEILQIIIGNISLTDVSEAFWNALILINLKVLVYTILMIILHAVLVFGFSPAAAAAASPQVTYWGTMFYEVILCPLIDQAVQNAYVKNNYSGTYLVVYRALDVTRSSIFSMMISRNLNTIGHIVVSRGLMLCSEFIHAALKHYIPDIGENHAILDAFTFILHAVLAFFSIRATGEPAKINPLDMVNKLQNSFTSGLIHPFPVR